MRQAHAGRVGEIAQVQQRDQRLGVGFLDRQIAVAQQDHVLEGRGLDRRERRRVSDVAVGEAHLLALHALGHAHAGCRARLRARQITMVSEPGAT